MNYYATHATPRLASKLAMMRLERFMDCHENPCGFSRNDDKMPIPHTKTQLFAMTAKGKILQNLHHFQRL